MDDGPESKTKVGNLLARGVACWLLLIVCGCKVGPDYCTPLSTANDTWLLEYHPRLQGEPASPECWWTQFNDPVLDQLVETSLSENLSLKEACQRVMEARARRNFVAGNLYPQSQAISGAYTKARASTRNANFFSFPGVFSPDLNPDNWMLSAGATWELDFWGKYRRAVESADASVGAACEAYHGAQVLLISELAAAYIDLRTAEYQLELAQRNLDVQQRTLVLIESKQEAGVATGLDVAQAETNVGQTAAVVPTLEVQRLQATYRLCLLLGRPPMELEPEIGRTAQIPKPPEHIGLGIPADVLRQRPDVRQAERNLAAQCARIGIAEADFYPHVSISGDIGVSAEKLSALFASGSTMGFVSPGFRWNILNYGRIRSNVNAEQAACQALYHAYQNSLLNAAQEVETAQAAYVFSFDRASALERAARGAADAVDRSQELYEAGAIDFGRVFILQAELLNQQNQLAAAKGEIAASLVQLYKAVGGGWQCAPTDAPLMASAEYTSRR